MRIAIFGGSFNPVHNGHVHLIEKIDERLEFDRIFIIPSKIPPHKSADEFVSEYHRLNMLRLSFEGNLKITISDFELLNEGKSYTVFTIRHFKELFPNDELFLLIGSDMFLSFDKWYCFEEILSLCTLAVISRRENDSIRLEKNSEKLSQSGGRCVIIPVSPLDISSTEIRTKIAQGEIMPCVLSDKVVKYIYDNKLYE